MINLLDDNVSPFSEVSSLKREKRDRNDSERNEGQASQMNLDLNVLLESWSDYTDPSMKKQGVCEQIQMSGLHPPSEPTRELIGREMHFSGLGPSNVPPLLGQNDAEVSLDLDLKPPCRPEPRFNWLDVGLGTEDSDVEIIGLSLSLVSSHKKPESCDKGIQQNIEAKLDLQDSTSAVLVWPEPHEGGPNSSMSDCFGSATSAPPGYPPQERPKGIVPSNSTSECFEPLKSAPPDYPHQEQPKGIGEASRCKVSSYDKKSANAKEVPQLSCCNKGRGLYTKSDNSDGSLVKDFCCKKIEIDLNFPPIDSDHQSHTPTNSSKPVEANEMLAKAPPEVVSQDHCVENNETQECDDGSHAHTSSSVPMEANEMLAEVPPKVVSQNHYAVNNESHDHRELHETSRLLKGGVAKCSNLVSKTMEREQEELNSPKDVNGADGLESEVSQGNNPTTADALSENDSKTAALDGNVPSPPKLASDDVAESDEGAMEENENGDAAESDEEIVNENDDAAESDEEIVEYEYEEVIEEVSCEDESDGSHDAVDAGDTDSEEYEEVIEEVSTDDESDSSTHHDGGAQDAELELYSPHKEHREGEAVEEVRGQREVSASHGKMGTSSVPATSPTIGPTQGDVIEEDILSPDGCTAMRQSSDLDMKTTIEKMLLTAALKTDQDWETKLGHNKSIVKAIEVGNSKLGLGSWETKSALNKDIAEATKEGNTKQGCGPWETKSTLKKNSVEGTEEGSTKQGWGTWGTKSEEGNKKQGWRSWKTKSGPNKDIAGASENGHHDAGRRENGRRMHLAPYGDARRHEGPFKHSRIINLISGSDRSSYGKEKSDYARTNRPYAESEQFSDNKSFRRDKPHPRGKKDAKRNDRFRIHENYRNQSNQFGILRSDYTWVRNDDRQNNDALHDAGQFPNTENAQECPDKSSSRRQRRQVNDTREGKAQPGSQRISHTIRNANPSDRYGGRNTPDIQAPEPREGRVVIRDLPSSSAGHHSFSHHNQQYVLQTENPQINATFRSALRSLENSPQSWLGSEHNEMQPSHQCVYYPQNIRAPRHVSTDDEREINQNGLQYNTNHPQQPQEETFIRFQYNHYGEQEQTADADFPDEREYAVRRGHPRPPPYGGREHAQFHDRGRGVSDRNIRNRLGDTSDGEQMVDAEYGFENGPRPRYGQDVCENFQEGGNPSESGGNIRNRLGGRGRGTSRGTRGRRGRGGKYRFNGREARHGDAEFSEARVKRRKY